MGNLGGAEILVIFLVGLIVLGPAKLPEAARQIGRAVNELRRVSGGFQKELREALEDPVKETQAMLRGDALKEPVKPAPTPPDEGDADPAGMATDKAQPSDDAVTDI